jgi:mono/diheme cytochrome c family protein
MTAACEQAAMRLLILLVAALSAFPARAGGQEPADRGSVLYIRKGCLGCHGASGRGGVGPTLASTRLSAAEFLTQLRTPRGIMPAFPSEVVSDAEGRAILGYLHGLAPLPPKLRADVPRGVLDQKTCAECHRRLHPTIVAQFEASAMGRAGVQNPRVTFPQPQMTCAACHGTNHDDIMASKGRVPETMCGACHQQIYKEHVLAAGHSYGPGPGPLGINWERNIGVPHYSQMPRKVMEMGCDPCHAQAGATDDKYWSAEQKKYVDTSSLTIRNGCIACHTRHAFNLEEARKPEACYTCHMGPDHPNYEAGAVYLGRRLWLRRRRAG